MRHEAKRFGTINKKHIPEMWKKRLAFLLTGILVLFCLSFSGPFTMTARAADPTDEIEHFVITVDVQDDASLKMTYHIDWKVLDDQEYGPLSWVDIGVPNKNHSDVTALGSSVSRIEDKGNTLAIYLDRSYYEDEVASFEFSFVQDHMYQIDRFVEGETVFAYTPAWFDDIEIKDLTIRWNADKAGAWQPDCLQEDGYLVFSTHLNAGDRYSITVAYPNDAFAFSVDRQQDDGSNEGGGSTDSDSLTFEDAIYGSIGLVFVAAFILILFLMILRFFRVLAGGLGFGSDAADADNGKKITRTKIEYYETCPGCGAGREEGKDNCPYCGRSMIKSKEIVEEKDLEKPENYSKSGTYRYGSDPNTYILVNVINTPVSRSSSRHSGGRSSGSGSSSRRSSSVPAPAHVLRPAGRDALLRSFSRTVSTAAEYGWRAKTFTDLGIR